MAETKQPAGAEKAAQLSPSEQAEVRASDKRDVSPRAAAPDLSGPRLRAIPWAGGTRKEVSSKDFARHGIKHPDVVFDRRRDNFTLPVGDKGISKEAADFLSTHAPTEFEYLDQG